MTTSVVPMRTITSLIVGLILILTAGAAAAGIGQEDGNPANTIHPNILNNVGGGANANPNGVSPTGGGNLHGIANAQGGNGGVANLGDVHGGIGAVNKNVD